MQGLPPTLSLISASAVRAWIAVGAVAVASCAKPADVAVPDSSANVLDDLGGFGPGSGKGDGGGETATAETASLDGGIDIAADASAACKDGSMRCTPAGGHETCLKAAWVDTPCTGKNLLCIDGKCVLCQPGQKKCADPVAGATYGGKVEACLPTGLAFATTETCASGACIDGACALCKPGTINCNGFKRETCSKDGKAWQPTPCDKEHPFCVKAKCYACPPAQAFCAEPEPDQVTSTVVLQCDTAGNNADFKENCTAPDLCYGGICGTCMPNETRCVDKGTLETCGSDGQGWSSAPCPANAPICAYGKCYLCLPNTTLCGPPNADGSPSNKVLQCNAAGDKATAKETCGAGLVCGGGKCAVCAGGGSGCLGDVAMTCTAQGGSWASSKACQADFVSCGLGACTCAPGQTACAPPPMGLGESKQLAECNANGDKASVTKTCDGDSFCDLGVCIACKPGAQRCAGSKAQICPEDGSAWQDVADCAATGLFCAGGGCRDLCDPDQPNATNIGCAFWAVQTDNSDPTDAGTVPKLAIAVANPNGKPAKLQFLWTDAKGKTQQLDTEVAANAQMLQTLPAADWGPQVTKLEGTSLTNRVVTLTSDIAVTATQFNPSDPNSLGSADSALLLPYNTLGKEYRALTQPQTQLGDPAFVSVVAVMDGQTVVQVTAAAKVMAGAGLPSFKVGVATPVTLKQGQVLNLETNALGADLTGTRVQSDKVVAVFSGNRSSVVPQAQKCVFAPNTPAGDPGVCKGTSTVCVDDVDCPSICCADHAEEQLPPVSHWGTAFVVAQLQPRDPSSKEIDVVRVLAAADQTTVATQPPQGPPKVLNAGEVAEFTLKADFVVLASKPVLVGQWMSSASTIGVAGNEDGDPMMQLVPPVSRFATLATFTVPDGYGKRYVNLAIPPGATASIDGAPVAVSAQILGSGGWSVARKAVEPGVHKLTATAPVGLTVYAWSKGVAVGTAGAVGLP